MGETEEGFDAFFTRSWSRLYAQAYVLTGSRETAQDLTQEALLRAWKHWPRVASFDDPEAWVRRVLHNLCIASWRSTSGRKLRQVHEIAPGGDPPDHHVLLAQAMRSLPGKQARALLLHDGLGMSIADTAHDLGAPEGTVKSWLSRARKVVAANLSPSTPDLHGADT